MSNTPKDIAWWVTRLKEQEAITDRIAAERDAAVPKGMMLIQISDAKNLARFAMNHAGNGLRSEVKLSGMRVAALAESALLEQRTK